MDWASMALVGRIVRPHGHRGQVVVASETDFGAERFAVNSTLQMLRDGRIVPVTVAASREQAGRWVIGLEGVESMNDAEALRGHELRVPAETLHELAAGAFYVHDLVGCVVESTARGPIGAVARVDMTAGLPLLVVSSGTSEEEVLVPFTDAICRIVDIGRKRIEIDPPEGLIELNRRKP
jgi:16S rRNA processing protein RimM